MPYPHRLVTGHIVRGRGERSSNCLILLRPFTEPGLALALRLSSREFQEAANGSRPEAHQHALEKDRDTTMKRLFATLMSVAVLAAFTPVSEAQTSCPAEVSKAKELLAKKGSMAKSTETQAPRS